MKVLLVPGVGMPAERFGPVIDLIETRGAGHVAQALDLPGVGRQAGRPCPLSLDEVVFDLRRRWRDGPRDDDRWAVVGLGFGATIAMAWAHAHPRDFERLVAINPGASAGPWQLTASAPIRAAWAAVAPDARARASRGLGLLVSDHKKRRQWAQERGEAEATASWLRPLACAAAARPPEQLPIPALILVSDGDKLISPGEGRRLAQQFGASLTLHGWGGHDLVADDPDWVAERIIDYLPRSSEAGVDAGGGAQASDEVTAFYDRFLSYLQKDRKRANPRHAYIKTRLRSLIEPGATVLDLGCGTGITTEFIDDLGVDEVIGVDLSSKLVEDARRVSPHIEFLVHDITTLDLGRSFDFLILADCLEHVPRERYPALFETLRRHMHGDSKVWLSIPCPTWLDVVRTRRPSMLQIIDNSVTLEEIQARAAEQGLQVKYFNTYGIDVPEQYNEYVLARTQRPSTGSRYDAFFAGR